MEGVPRPLPGSMYLIALADECIYPSVDFVRGAHLGQVFHETTTEPFSDIKPCWSPHRPTGRQRECLDRILIFGRGGLESTLRVYVEHYNCHRPHRPLDMEPPAPPNPPSPVDDSSGRLIRRDVLSGLIHEYERERAA